MGPLSSSHVTLLSASVNVTYTYSLLCLLPYQSGLCHIDIQQSLFLTFVNSGRFLGRQRQELA